jgi:AcrR family transcriptional regulator
MFNQRTKIDGGSPPSAEAKSPRSSEKQPTRGDSARMQILEVAIRLFRRDGFDETTMRTVASEVGMALGLTYHYFPSKEALVMAYYESVQLEHRRMTQAKLADIPSLRDRLAMLLHTKLEILKDDRKLMGALFRYTGNPDHPLSFLGPSTAPLRADCVTLFAEALHPERLPDDLREFMPIAMWALHMGVLLYFLYDQSPDQHRTHQLVDDSIELVVRFLKLARLPLLRPARRSVMGLLHAAELIPQTT